MRARLAVLVLTSLLGSACSAPIDLAKSCRVSIETTGWFDAGITADGKNKLVPSVVFRVSNTGDKPFNGLQFNCIFKRVGDPEEWSTVFIGGASAGFDHLQPGATSPPITVRAQQGYTGIQPRADILQNKLFVDAKVEIFGKAGSARSGRRSIDVTRAPSRASTAAW
jgi:hypothetical protein